MRETIPVELPRDYITNNRSDCPGTAVGFPPECWSPSDRNAGRHRAGTAVGFARNTQVYTAKLAYSREEWANLPKELILRQIKVTVNNPGFRTQGFYIITTLLDASQYPAKELAEIYFKRWDVELFFRDIKTTMGMDILRCQTPEMIRKEIQMNFIAYNCVRRLMYEAAEEADIEVRVVSFKGSLQALRNWEPHLNQAKVSKSERFRLISDLYDAMTNTPLRQRPGRSEPRCIKRRPKSYQLLTAPRHEMKEVPHRSKYYAAKP
jgi:hypothetical protein